MTAGAPARGSLAGVRAPPAVVADARYRTVTVKSPGVRNIASDAQARSV